MGRTERAYHALRVAALFAIPFMALLSVCFAFDTPVSAIQTIPYKMNFQGKLADANGVPIANGTYNMKFRIFDAASNGTEQWNETRSVFAGTGVTVTTGGLFSVQLGDVTSLPVNIFTNQNLYFEVELPTPATATCSTSACESYTEGAMTPRNKLGSSAYAFNSDTLDGIDSSGFIQSTTTPQTANIAIQSSGASNVAALVQGAASQSADIFQVKGNGVTTPFLAVGANGSIGIRPSSDATPVLVIQSNSGNNMLTVDSANARVGIGLGGNNQPGLSGAGLEVQGALRLSAGGGDPAGYTDSYLTPAGSTVPTKISIPAYDPGNYGQIIAMGIPSNASSTARVMSLFDARGSAHQPTIGVFNPNEDQIFGFSWDGTNDTGFVKNTASKIALQGGGVDLITAFKSGTDAIATLGVAGVNAGKLTFATAANANTVTLQSASQTGSYSLTIPTLSANDTLCTTGLSNCANGTMFIQNSGSPQTASFNVTGNGTIGGTLTTTGGALVKVTSATALQVQNASSASVLTVDTSANRLVVGDATAGSGADVTVFVVDKASSSNVPTGVAGAMYYDSTNNKFKCYTTSWVDCDTTGGGGSSTQTVYLSPEYTGGLLNADGTNNNGFMTTAYDATNDHNYYNWTSGQVSLQDYSIYVRTKVPSNYTSGFGSFKIWMYGASTSTANNDIQVEIKDSGTTCSALTSYLPGTASTWTERAITTSGCTGIAANDILTIQIKLFSKSDSAVRVGGIQYGYTN